MKRQMYHQQLFLLNCLKLKIALAANDWDESEVKRDKFGRFAPKNENSIKKDDVFKQNSNLLLTPDVDLSRTKIDEEFKKIEEGIEKAGEENTSNEQIDIREELNKLGEFYEDTLRTVKGESKRLFEEAINSKLYKSIQDGSIKDEAKNVAKDYGDKLQRLYEESSKIIENNKENDELNLGGVVKDAINRVSEGLKNANEEQLQILAGGLVLGSTIALTGFLAAGVLPIASQLAMGGIAGDVLFTSALIDDFRNTINMNESPEKILKNIEELSKKEGEEGEEGEEGSNEKITDVEKLQKIIALSERMKKQHKERIKEIEEKKGEVLKELREQKIERVSEHARNTLQNNRESIKKWEEETDKNIKESIDNAKEGFKKMMQSFKVVVLEDALTVREMDKRLAKRIKRGVKKDFKKNLEEGGLPKALKEAYDNHIEEGFNGLKDLENDRKSLNLEIGLKDLKEKINKIAKGINQGIEEANS